MNWHTSRRKIALDRPLVMGILNVTPDSFSDGGSYQGVDDALRRVEQMIEMGVDIIDIGGESTRPGSVQIDASVEIDRTASIVAAIAKRFDIPISIDTSKSVVAKANLDHGAEIINDISGLRWDAAIANVAADSGSGLVLMHSRGAFATMHSQPTVDDVLAEVADGLARSVDIAKERGVTDSQIVLDVGLGFGKTPEQNLKLLASFAELDLNYPTLIGASRKSFIGRFSGGGEPSERLAGSLAAAVFAVANGAKIVRVHDVRETVQALKLADALIKSR